MKLSEDCFGGFVWRRLLYGSFLAVALRVIWQLWPNTWTCAVFWAHFYVMPFVSPSAARTTDHPKPSMLRVVVGLSAFALIVTGVSMNAIVTLANGGFMPVGSDIKELGSSLWVTSTEAHRLVWMADNYAGFSLGDFCVFAGFIGAFWSFGKPSTGRDEREPQSSRMTVTGIWRVGAGFMTIVMAADARTHVISFSFALAINLVGYVFSLWVEWQDIQQRNRERVRADQFRAMFEQPQAVDAVVAPVPLTTTV